MNKTLVYLGMFLTFYVYGNLEVALRVTNSNSNFAMNGVFRGLIYKRNAVYILSAISLLGYLTGCKFVLIPGILLCGFFSFKMYKTIHKYNLFELLLDDIK